MKTLGTTTSTLSATPTLSFFLDIEMIDKQHARFFVMFDKIQEIYKSNKHVDTARVVELIDELEKYTNVHFLTEEALMRNAGYDDIEYHLVQHKLFTNKIQEFRTASDYKNVLLVQQMVDFLRKWFVMHITVVDYKYVDPVKKYLSARK